MLQFGTLTPPDARYDRLFLANYATITLQPELARLPGVGQVNIFGAGKYSMRIWIDPNKLPAFSLTTEDVVNALNSQNQQVTAGQLGMPPGPNTQAFQYTLDIAARLDEVSQFENIVVKSEPNGQMVHLRDVGRVELGAQTYSEGFTVNMSTLFAIVLAIGIVVDDAIVVVEGAAHHIERGVAAKEAAIRAMDELFGPIIGITLVLMAVFLPAAFIPGLTGKMFAQFALVIAATALLSAINAATLKPTQCALWL